MKPLEVVKKSPITNATLTPYLSCVDHTVSHLQFYLVKDEISNLLITSPRPFSKDLMTFYESEDYISHNDSKEKLLNKIYQAIKKYTVKQKVNNISKVKKTITNILDIGCGTGDFLKACSDRNWIIYGVEPHASARQISIQKTNSNTIYDSIESLNKENANQKFDIISLWHVLEHVPNLNDYTKSLQKLLKPDGVLIVAVPNFMSFDAQYYKSFWAAYDVPRHLWHFSPKSVKMLFSKVEMTVKKTRPMFFDSFYISILSEKNKNGNLFRAVVIGLLSNIKAIFTHHYSSLTYIIENNKI